MSVVAKGFKVADEIAIIPVLRAGLGMADSMTELLPAASVHHIGMYRSKDSLLPVQYYNKLPKNKACDVAYIIDPCIATSNTLHAVCTIIKVGSLMGTHPLSLYFSLSLFISLFTPLFHKKTHTNIHTY